MTLEEMAARLREMIEEPKVYTLDSDVRTWRESKVDKREIQELLTDLEDDIKEPGKIVRFLPPQHKKWRYGILYSGDRIRDDSEGFWDASVCAWKYVRILETNEIPVTVPNTDEWPKTAKAIRVSFEYLCDDLLHPLQGPRVSTMGRRTVEAMKK